MEKVNLFCSECGEVIEENSPFLQGPDHEGQFLCESCFHLIDQVQWHKHLSLEELVNLLNHADYYRWTQFCISYIGGKQKYIVAKEAYPSVFSVLTTRDELASIIVSRT